jgi:hypothetical protein
MQRYTVYLFPETALHVSGGISTHHQEHIQLYLQHLALVKRRNPKHVEQFPEIINCVMWHLVGYISE